MKEPSKLVMAWNYHAANMDVHISFASPSDLSNLKCCVPVNKQKLPCLERSSCFSEKYLLFT